MRFSVNIQNSVSFTRNFDWFLLPFSRIPHVWRHLVMNHYHERWLIIGGCVVHDIILLGVKQLFLLLVTHFVQWLKIWLIRHLILPIPSFIKILYESSLLLIANDSWWVTVNIIALNHHLIHHFVKKTFFWQILFRRENVQSKIQW